MNDLQDLRSTLDARAGDVSGLDHGQRRTQVAERIETSRRRRSQARAGVAGLAVVAVGAAVVLPRLDGADVAPADRTVLGIEAPELVSAADGWTYVFDHAEESAGDKVSLHLPESDRPRLVTWATAGDAQDVRILGPEADWISDEADFADYVVVPQGYQGTVRAMTAEGRDGVALAVYDVDVDAPPAGVGDPSTGFFLRESSAALTQAGAVVGEPGELDLTVPWEGAALSLAVQKLCSGLPEGASVNVSLTGAEVPAGASLSEAARDGLVDSYGECDHGPSFDGGQWPEMAVDLDDAELSGSGTARIWASASEDDATPLERADAPRARLGLGLYTPAGTVTEVLGLDLPEAVDLSGHRWELEQVQPVRPGESVDVSALTVDGPVYVGIVQRVRKGGWVSLLLATEGGPELQRTELTTDGGTGQMGAELLLPGTRSFSFDLTGGDAADVLDMRAFVYRLAD